MNSEFAKLKVISSNTRDCSEEDTIAAAQRGDSSAFHSLYEEYRSDVYQLIDYWLNDPHLAEEALQSVFVKVYRALPYFRLESSFKTWLFRVAINECKNLRRRRRLFLPLTTIAETFHDRKHRPDVQHLAGETSRILREAVMQLKPKYRTVIVLRYLEELSYEEIASTLNCSPGTVASRLNRALLLLQNAYRKRDKEMNQ